MQKPTSTRRTPKAVLSALLGVVVFAVGLTFSHGTASASTPCWVQTNIVFKDYVGAQKIGSTWYWKSHSFSVPPASASTCNDINVNLYNSNKKESVKIYVQFLNTFNDPVGSPKGGKVIHRTDGYVVVVRGVKAYQNFRLLSSDYYATVSVKD